MCHQLCLCRTCDFNEKTHSTHSITDKICYRCRDCICSGSEDTYDNLCITSCPQYKQAKSKCSPEELAKRMQKNPKARDSKQL